MKTIIITEGCLIDQKFDLIESFSVELEEEGHRIWVGEFPSFESAVCAGKTILEHMRRIEKLGELSCKRYKKIIEC